MYPRFKLGAQPGLDGSNRAAGLLKIKWLPQTCSAEFFSASWDGVNHLCDWFLTTIYRASVQTILKFHLYLLCLEDEKTLFFSALLRVFAQPSTPQDVTMAFSLKKINSIGTWSKFSEFCFFQICWSACLTGYCYLGLPFSR